MATAGPTYTGTGANFNDGGTTAWTNPTNIQGNTTSTAATCAPPSNGNTSQRLRCTNFGFALGTFETVTGITVEVEQQAGNNNRHRWNSVKLLIAGSEAGGEKSDGSAIPTSKGFKTFGGSADLWSLTPTAAQINASNFGVSLKIDRNASQSTTTSLFRCRITVTYTTDAGTGTVTLTGSAVESYSVPGPLVGAVYPVPRLDKQAELANEPRNYLPIPLAGGQTFNDAGSGSVTLTGTGSETASHTRSGSGAVTFGFGRVDAASHTRSGSGALTLAGSSTESATHTQATPGAVTVTGSGIESYQPPSAGPIRLVTRAVPRPERVDDRLETRLVGPLITDTTYVDSGTGTVTLAGSSSESHYVATPVLPPQAVYAVPIARRAPARIVSRIIRPPQVTGIFNDAGAGTLTFGGTRLESHAHIDPASGTITLTGARGETFTTADARAGALTFGGARSETAAHTSSLTGTLTWTGSAIESWFSNNTYVDAMGGSFTLAGGRADSSSHNGSGTVTLTIAGTRSESQSGSASRTGTLTLAGTSVEFKAYMDARAGLLTLGFNRSDTATHTRTGTGQLTIGGSATEDFHSPGGENPQGGKGDPNEELLLLHAH